MIAICQKVDGFYFHLFFLFRSLRPLFIPHGRGLFILHQPPFFIRRVQCARGAGLAVAVGVTANLFPHPIGNRRLLMSSAACLFFFTKYGALSYRSKRVASCSSSCKFFFFLTTDIIYLLTTSLQNYLRFIKKGAIQI